MSDLKRTEEICQAWARGQTFADLSKEYKICSARVGQIVKKHFNDSKRLADNVAYLRSVADRIELAIKFGDMNEAMRETMSITLESIYFSARTERCLKNINILTIGDLVSLSEHSLLRLPNFGRKSLNELKDILDSMGLQFRGTHALVLEDHTIPYGRWIAVEIPNKARS